MENLERTWRELVEKVERKWRETFLIDFSVRSVCHEKTSTHFARISLRHEKTAKHFSLLSVSRKNIDALGINYTVSRENKTANHFDFARISARHQKTADIELVVRKEDSTSNRRLSSLNFNLSSSISFTPPFEFWTYTKLHLHS